MGQIENSEKQPGQRQRQRQLKLCQGGNEMTRQGTDETEDKADKTNEMMRQKRYSTQDAKCEIMVTRISIDAFILQCNFQIQIQIQHV
jgi:hypothetical protein